MLSRKGARTVSRSPRFATVPVLATFSAFSEGAAVVAIFDILENSGQNHRVIVEIFWHDTLVPLVASHRLDHSAEIILLR